MSFFRADKEGEQLNSFDLEAVKRYGLKTALNAPLDGFLKDFQILNGYTNKLPNERQREKWLKESQEWVVKINELKGKVEEVSNRKNKIRNPSKDEETRELIAEYAVLVRDMYAYQWELRILLSRSDIVGIIKLNEELLKS